jgi:hypothetical protein
MNFWVHNSSHLGSSENLLEMKFLSFISDVDYLISFQSVESVINGCHVSGVIVETSIRFDDNQRLFDLGCLREEDAHCSIVLCYKVLSLKSIEQWLDHGVIETLSNLLDFNV